MRHGGRLFVWTLGGLVLAALAWSQPVGLSEPVRAFVAFEAPVFALKNVRVVDGTGAPAAENQTVIVRLGRIEAVGPVARTAVPPGATVLDRAGYTVLPGLVMLHEHFFYALRGGGPGSPALSVEHGYSFPRLYLAGGVTSLRTGGSIEPYTDLALKAMIDQGRMPGPKVHVT